MTRINLWASVSVFIAALVLLAIMSGTARAQVSVCVPVDEIKAQLMSAGVDEDRIEVTEGAGFVNDYTRYLGVGIPDGSEPSGAIFIHLPNVVRFGIIETSGCVRYHMPVPTPRHVIAFAASRKGT
jgi:hypothetical protein